MKIIIIDDHPVVCHGLKSLIEANTGFEVIDTALDARRGMRLVLENKPDIVTVDIAMRGMSGLELIANIREMASDVKIIVVSMYDERIYAPRAIQAGAVGYVMKEEAAGRLVAAIKTVAQGDLFFSEDLKAQILKSMVAGVRGNNSHLLPEDILSNRELAVFEAIGTGETTGEISEKLLISEKTVQTYRSRIKNKLGLKNKGELSKKAIKWVKSQGG